MQVTLDVIGTNASFCSNALVPTVVTITGRVCGQPVAILNTFATAALPPAS